MVNGALLGVFFFQRKYPSIHRVEIQKQGIIRSIVIIIEAGYPLLKSNSVIRIPLY